MFIFPPGNENEQSLYFNDERPSSFKFSAYPQKRDIGDTGNTIADGSYHKLVQETLPTGDWDIYRHVYPDDGESIFSAGFIHRDF